MKMEERSLEFYYTGYCKIFLSSRERDVLCWCTYEVCSCRNIQSKQGYIEKMSGNQKMRNC